jgi:hypothetical protein
MKLTRMTRTASLVGTLLVATFTAAVLFWSSPARAGNCSSVSRSEQIPERYGTGFFSESNPANPMNLVPSDRLACQYAVRGVEDKIRRQVQYAEYLTQQNGKAQPDTVRAAASQQWIGSSDLDHGDYGKCLAALSGSAKGSPHAPSTAATVGKTAAYRG